MCSSMQNNCPRQLNLEPIESNFRNRILPLLYYIYPRTQHQSCPCHPSLFIFSLLTPKEGGQICTWLFLVRLIGKKHVKTVTNRTSRHMVPSDKSGQTVRKHIHGPRWLRVVYWFAERSLGSMHMLGRAYLDTRHKPNPGKPVVALRRSRFSGNWILTIEYWKFVVSLSEA
jgi:hypothetical protein